MIVLDIYIPLIAGLFVYAFIASIQDILKFRFKLLYPLAVVVIVLLSKEWMLFLFIATVLVLEFIYFFVSFFKEHEEMSWFKIHFLTLTVLIFIILISTIDKYFFFFQILLFLAISFFYAIVILLGEKYFKGNIFGVVGLSSLFGVIPFVYSSSFLIGAIIGGTVSILPILTYYVLLPSFSKNRFQYFVKNLLYILFLELLFQAFLLFSANLAYGEAVKLEVKGIEDKTVWNFYNATLKEIYIDNNTRWSYHRFRYVNEWK